MSKHASLATSTLKEEIPHSKESTGSFLHSALSWCRNLFKGNTPTASFEESVTELMETHDAHGNSMNASERTMLYNILGFGELKVSQIMTPRTDIIAVASDATLDELQTLVVDKEHTRMPVYEGDLDTVIGFIHIKDLIPYLGNSEPFTLDKIVRKALFVSPFMKVIDLLSEMRFTRVHMALVVDEHGGIDGLVTIEDLVEEIVGDIQDEHDGQEIPQLEQRNPKEWIASARIPIEELEDALGLSIPEEEETEYDTLGGLIFSALGRVPGKGEFVIHELSGLEFKVLDADPRKIRTLLIKLPDTPPSASDAT